jgi:DNA-binding MarR family transcriptional regulator
MIGLLTRCDLALARRRSAIARRLELSESELVAVTTLLHHGELTASRLARRLDLSSGGMTQLIRRLELRGHITRAPNPDDGRSQLVRVSDALALRLREELRSGIDGLAGLEGVEAVLDALARSLEGSVDPDPAPGPPSTESSVPSLWAYRSTASRNACESNSA